MNWKHCKKQDRPRQPGIEYRVGTKKVYFTSPLPNAQIFATSLKNHEQKNSALQTKNPPQATVMGEEKSCLLDKNRILIFLHEIKQYAKDIDKEKFKTPFLTFQNHLENRTSIALKFPEHPRVCHRDISVAGRTMTRPMLKTFLPFWPHQPAGCVWDGGGMKFFFICISKTKIAFVSLYGKTSVSRS